MKRRLPNPIWSWDGNSAILKVYRVAEYDYLEEDKIKVPLFITWEHSGNVVVEGEVNLTYKKVPSDDEVKKQLLPIVLDVTQKAIERKAPEFTGEFEAFRSGLEGPTEPVVSPSDLSRIPQKRRSRWGYIEGKEVLTWGFHDKDHVNVVWQPGQGGPEKRLLAISKLGEYRISKAIYFVEGVHLCAASKMASGLWDRLYPHTDLTVDVYGEFSLLVDIINKDRAAVSISDVCYAMAIKFLVMFAKNASRSPFFSPFSSASAASASAKCP